MTAIDEIRVSARRPRNQLDRLEAAIVARLKDQMPGRIERVEPFSDEAQQFDFEGNHGAIFVRYSGSTYSGDDTSINRVYAPHRVLTWDVYLLLRSIKGAQDGTVGANEALEEIRLALQGQSLCGATAMKVLSDRLEAQVEGGWRWVMQFSHVCPAIARAQTIGRCGNEADL